MYVVTYDCEWKSAYETKEFQNLKSARAYIRYLVDGGAGIAHFSLHNKNGKPLKF